ncbi:hypothetical protein SAMN05192574_101401 [Mucilaginibacter gossypiicola]|uniref:Uncharacterized protein n=1 Tax=Mucilaginibacter gossypiicola TaxID=551995 RepID=A0A1H8A8E2_9SPHI|nr:hypothetical protein [Mucilaginibacter gossypiicola]SEM66736.1 hypothetical protein SAMN05192574_101401 [Mucilaginibacter gossypiicola]
MSDDKKYTFRKMYFQVENDRVIQDNVGATNVYQRKEDAIKTWRDYTRLTPYYWEKGKPQIKREVVGFYLVHESLFEEILKRYTKQVIDASEEGGINHSQ